MGLGGNQAAKLTNDGGAISDLANLAGQNALVKNQLTALVYAETAPAADGTKKQAFSVWDLPGSSAYDADSGAPTWEQVSPWKYLDASVNVDTNSSFLASPSTPFAPTTTTIPKISGVPVQKVYYQFFLPSGQMMGASLPQIKLVQNANANFYTIVINPATGRAIVERP